MQFFRLIKPDWAKRTLANGKPNPKFIQEINGNDVLEGCNFTSEFLQQKNNEGYNVYFFPNHPSSDVYATGTQHLSGKQIDIFNFVFVDMDLKDGVYATKDAFIQKLKEFPLKPTLVNDSGNGVHAYWRVNNLKRDQYVLMQMALLTYFNTDTSVYTVLQLMRAPGFFNTKKLNEFKQSQIVADVSSNQTYEISQFPKEIFNISQEKMVKVQNHINRLDGKLEIQLEHEANVDELPDEFVTLLGANDTIDALFNRPKEYNGDRSSADMKLANILFNRNMSKRDALRVIANTQKALEKGVHRFDYAQLTIDKVYVERTPNQFKTAAEYIASSDDIILPPQVLGPYYMDFKVLGKPWRKTELLGLIAGSGVGKTAMALDIIRHIIANNQSNDDLFVFFSLEMPASSVIERWINLVGEGSPLTNRLIVIDNYTDEGMPRHIGLQQIYEYCKDIKRARGKELGAVVIDHLHLISRVVDTSKQSEFVVEADEGFGMNQKISFNKIATSLKSLTKAINTFGIILTQTTKEKGVGDLPIGKDGAYGISQYEWIMDRIITIWQPLMRVQHMTNKRYLAYQYVKIREKNQADSIFENDPKLLTYNMANGQLEVTTGADYEHFKDVLPHANAAREAIRKKEASQYSIQVDLSGLDEVTKHLQVIK